MNRISLKNNFPLELKLGVIGGGQLSRMLGQSAQARGLKYQVYAERKNECALQITPFSKRGKLSDFKKVIEFADSCDQVTFESEFFPALEFLSFIREQGRQDLEEKFFPRLPHLAIFQKRNTQKNWLIQHGIPTTDFRYEAFSLKALVQLSQIWQKGLVLKKNFGGYDGYGTYFLPKLSDKASEDSLTNLLEKSLKESLPELLSSDLIAEARVSFKRELAVSVACSSKSLVFLPLVETKQSDGRCDWVMGPIKHQAFTSLKKKLTKALKKIGYRGLISFELFDTGKSLLVNEVAPRVHNSAHYSLNALSCSQFEYHWRAGLDLKLETPQNLSKFFVMTNLIGSSDKDPCLPDELNGYLYWYGKHPNRAKRKMGHINYLGNTDKISLLHKALRERKKILI